ncbi:translation elongation factor Ts [Spirulina sp. CCNP1310]|uniref:translation elongation factor Ts n=1 Tax=Spirulina sp. CCNP1310 TaxID=3110249 RepID=UPI002B1FA9F4|nr:translation elongation factor Ts [Spirulina sp. CCNP1310]MEA5420809.1 translation elongation factor Ts [Spirulina sp. CCNP1310]
MSKKSKKSDKSAPKAKSQAPAPVEAPKAEVAAAPVEAPKAEVVAAAPVEAPKAEPKSGGVSAAQVKQLRDQTGAGMMDCKKALNETNGNLEEAIAWLRQKGIASAEKKAGRVAAEGLVGSYIHTGGRVGVLVEVNCETDFVARRDEFQELVRNVAMQIAACPNVEYVRVSDIPQAFVDSEKAIEMSRDDLGNKPEAIKAKIIEGRIEKRLKEIALLDQPYVKDQSITVDEMVKQVSGQIGEKIEVRRFSRFVLGEGIEKKEADFAAEVAAQAGLA